jgi:hypothetical protein
MITISIPLALLILGAVAFVGTLVGFLTAVLCWSAARGGDEYDANARMFAGAEALDSMDEEGA